MQPLRSSSVIPTASDNKNENKFKDINATLDQALARREWTIILQDSKLFLQLFSRCYNFYKKAGSKEIVVIKKSVEVLRCEFAEAYEKFSNVHIKVFSGKNDDVYISGKALEFRDIHVNHELGNQFIFKICVLRYLPDFAKSLGMTYQLQDNSSKYEELCAQLKGDQAHNTAIWDIKLSWNQELTFQIPPLAPLPKANVHEAQYALYEKGEFCDLTIKCKDEEIKAHRLVVFALSGDPFKAMCQFREGKESVITIDDYSLATIKTFLDFTYLGYEVFFKKVTVQLRQTGQLSFDAVEVLDFADKFIMQNLKIACINILCLSAKPSQKKKIIRIADQYKSDLLRKLYDHLNQDSGKNLLVG